MSNIVTLANSGSVFIGDTGRALTGMVVFQTSSGGASFSFVPTAAVTGSGLTPLAVTFYDMLVDPRTKIAAGTAITQASNSVYGVISPGMGVFASNSSAAASASLTVTMLEGAVW